MEKKKTDLWTVLDRLMPPGMVYNGILTCVLWMGLIQLGVWFSCLLRFHDELHSLEVNIAQRSYASFTDFPDMGTVSEYLHLFSVFSLFCAFVVLCLTVFNYAYFYRDSKSIFLMKRIQSPFEIHKLCWTVPAIGAAAVLLLMALLYGGFCLIYFSSVPSQCLPEQTIAFLWRYVP